MLLVWCSKRSQSEVAQSNDNIGGSSNDDLFMSESKMKFNSAREKAELLLGAGVTATLWVCVRHVLQVFWG